MPNPSTSEVSSAADAAVSDETLYDRAKTQAEEAFPLALWDRIADGQAPVAAFRAYRELTPADLAGGAGMTVDRLGAIEAGAAPTAAETARLARALRLPVDHLTDDPDA